MKNRKLRLDYIVQLINTRTISSQEELSDLLEKAGHGIAQPTLSRDLKTLNVTKMITAKGKSIYVLPDNPLHAGVKRLAKSTPESATEKGFLSLRFSNNMAVIKTRIGYAAGLAYDIDMSHIPQILGTIPGSDTILVVIDEKVSHEEAYKIFSKILPLNRHA